MSLIANVLAAQDPSTVVKVGANGSQSSVGGSAAKPATATTPAVAAVPPKISNTLSITVEVLWNFVE
jgi:hypothetical protein